MSTFVYIPLKQKELILKFAICRCLVNFMFLPKDRNMLKSTVYLSILAAVFAVSCTQTAEEKPKYTVIAGTITNAQSTVVQAMHQFQEIALDSLSESGSFHLRFLPEEADYFMLRFDQTGLDLFLSPGDSLYVSFDTEDVAGTFKAENDKALENTFIRQRRKLTNDMQLNDIFSLMALDKDVFENKVDSAYKQLEAAFNAFAQQENIDEEFLLLEETDLELGKLSKLHNYPMYHVYVKRITDYEEGEFDIVGVKERVAALDFNDDRKLRNQHFEDFANSKVREVIRDAAEKDSTLMTEMGSFNKALFEITDSIFDNQKVKDYLKYSALKADMEYRGPAKSEALYEQFLATNQTPLYAQKLEEIVVKWESIAPGKEVPDLAFETMEGEAVKLSDLQGNLVYIDVWATWCGPCIAEHPHWDKLKNEYADKKVAFVTISIDDSREPWKKMVTNKKMEGYQWFAEGAWQSELVKHFMINGIPRFILLDKAGKVLDPSADRPSGSIRQTLDLHLEAV